MLREWTGRNHVEIAGHGHRHWLFKQSVVLLGASEYMLVLLQSP